MTARTEMLLVFDQCRLSNFKCFVVLLIIWLACSGIATGKEIVLGDRLKFEPEIVLSETYSDNIYQTDTDRQSDFITSIMPGIDTQFAFTPEVKIGLIYLGIFNFYQDADNFKKDNHYGNANLKMETPKGSTLEIGAWGEDSANSPDSAVDRSKDYTIRTWYGDASLKMMAETELFGNYKHSIRRFDDEMDIEDDYDRDSVALGVINSRSELFPLLLEYRYVNQQNDEIKPEPTEFTYNSAYTGFRWREDKRLSGTLRVGYLWSEYNNTDAYDGWATDTQLSYRAGPFTIAQLSIERGVRESTRTARDTLDYYVYASGGLSLNYSRFDPLRIYLFGDYENRDYRLADATAENREDDFVIAGLTARYRFKDWFSFSIGYRYRNNDSTINDYDYIENRFYAEVILFSLGEVRSRRWSEDLERIRDF